jgi:hypothetical protein
MKFFRIISTFGLLAFASFPMHASFAHPPEKMTEGLKKSCESDLQKYCKDVTQGAGRVMACLKAHDDKLTPACKQGFEAAQAEFHKNMKAAHAACAGDVQKFCGGVEKPKDVASCLNSHTADLSSQCKDFRQSHHGMGSHSNTSS